MINPVLYTEQVLSDFLKYQLTAYPFADKNLYEQMRSLLNLEETRRSPLFKGPYVSLSRMFRQGALVSDLVKEGVLHPLMTSLAPYPRVYGHQEQAIRAIHQGKTTLVSTGTGSGKTESFLYPIVSRCLQLRDSGKKGVVAVIVYPMNALAEDQLLRLRAMLAGSGVTFGMYTGNTKETPSEAIGHRLPAGSTRADYQAAREKHPKTTIHPPEERVSRQEMRKLGDQPQILLTNVKQLELILTRQTDVEIFKDAPLEFIVFDEAHTFTGAAGAETTVLIRRLREYCGRTPSTALGIATSATLADAERGEGAALDFAQRFFGAERDQVVLVSETYEPDAWSEVRTVPSALPGDPRAQLKNVIDALGDDSPVALKLVVQSLTGTRLPGVKLEQELYDMLSKNELVYQLSECLKSPMDLQDLVEGLSGKVGRKVPEEEVMVWLALGAAARKDDRPLLRPVLHAFVRGINGAVVTLGEHPDTLLKLHLSAEDAQQEKAPGVEVRHFPVMACTTCGQHYLTHHVADFAFSGKNLSGGETISGNTLWRSQDGTLGGKRVVLLDRLISSAEDAVLEEEEGQEPQPSRPTDATPPRSTQVFLCRHCGGMHEELQDGRCHACGHTDALRPLFVVQQNAERPGHLTSCVSCGNRGKGLGSQYREPARTVRATTVSDVHILGQSMLQRQEGNPRLLVFTDNRQDAAFQAGWMQDRARRFRLRNLMHQHLPGEGSISLGDLADLLDQELESNVDLSRTLLTEVWSFHDRQAEPLAHTRERKRYLRIQLLREITLGSKQRLGLEPWGRMQVSYRTLSENAPFIQKWAELLKLTPERLVGGIAVLVDSMRRKAVLYDAQEQLYSRSYLDGSELIQKGYFVIPLGGPKGVKFQRGATDREGAVQAFYSDKGSTAYMQMATSFGVPAEHLSAFLQEAFDHLVTLDLLTPAQLVYNNNKAIAGTEGVYQVNADQVMLRRHRGFYRCTVCRRTSNRLTPRGLCSAHRCSGQLVFEDENPENFDLMQLDEGSTMLRPREHSAQVPAREREIIERAFKSETSTVVNTLVATSTLEMGVDIGGLDTVLMRNVPPLPANYWQRAGRAGRRHRLAVNLTYARPASHDRAYYADPLKLLRGAVTPPKLNLRNELMVRKHIHAVMLSTLSSLSKGSALPDVDRIEVTEVLKSCFPARVGSYLFTSGGLVLPEPHKVQALKPLIEKHLPRLMASIKGVFQASWPKDLLDTVTDQKLQDALLTAPQDLQEIVNRIYGRLKWAREQIQRLNKIRDLKGDLDKDEDALFRRCDTLIKKLKGTQKNSKSEDEGVDDTNTYAVLAVEGYLPGYGLDTGSIRGEFKVPFGVGQGPKEYALSRPTGAALREYIPGNLIYANGQKFTPRHFQLPPGDPTLFRVDVEKQTITEVGTGGPSHLKAADAVLAYPISDVIMAHSSNISDEEENRFQMPVSVYALDQKYHSGGKTLKWGDRTVNLLHGAKLRLINVGAASLTQQGELGYPVCPVCGQSRSPFSSKVELDNFTKSHRERCGKEPLWVGFYTDVTADALFIQDCQGFEEAFSLAEALRLGASEVLEMEVDDLQILTLPHTTSDKVDVILYDPMPGGSGLLEQLLEQFEAVVQAAVGVTDCPSGCERVCVDCMMTFRNAHYHRYLDRKGAAATLSLLGATIKGVSVVPPRIKHGSEDSGGNVNKAEERMFRFLERAGFDPVKQHPIQLKPNLRTVVDFFFEDPSERSEGICVYLDGLSRHIHGNTAHQNFDGEIRDLLMQKEYEVLSLPASHLDDPDALVDFMGKLGRKMYGKKKAEEITSNPVWLQE